MLAVTATLLTKLPSLSRYHPLGIIKSVPFIPCSARVRCLTSNSSCRMTAQPPEGQHEMAQSKITAAESVTKSDKSCHVEIQEGKAKILFPNSNEVFYNPVQEFNRDLSIAVIKYYSDHLWTPKFSKKKSAKHKPIEGQSSSTYDSTPSVPEGSSNNQTVSDVLDKSNSITKDELQKSSFESPQNETATCNTEESVSSSTAGKSETTKPAELVESGDEKEAVCEGEDEEEGNGMEVEDQDRGGEREPGNDTLNVQSSSGAGGDGSGDGRMSSREPGLKILEALAASGLRSIRYALEIPRVETVVANDLSKDAYHSICRNIEHNQVGERVKPSWREASMLMYEHREPFSNRFDVIDLDPYGSPSIFLDSTVQAVKDGGLLCVTCTDMSVLCGTHSESCHSKYGAMSLKAKFCHEMALRIVLASLESHANRYRRYIVPLMSCSIDFYIRLFVRVFTSPAEVKRSPSKLAMVYNCIGCESYHLQPVGKRIEEGRSRKYPASTGPPVDRNCDQCGSVFRLGGPIWAEAIHDMEFVKNLLSYTKKSPKGTYHTIQRITGLLTVISEELAGAPLYYVLDSISSTMHCSQPKMLAIRSAILNAGYRVSISHANANAIKTDAPHHVIWDIMRCWAQTSTVKQPGPNTPAAAILSKPPKINASFVIRKDANPPSRLLKLARFPENPEANWGPKARAKRSGDGAEDLAAKRRKLQGKRTNS